MSSLLEAKTVADMPLKIMLVDDNRTFALAVKRFLDMVPGVQVIAQAHDGEEALCMVDAHRPDLLLLDIGLPGINGLEVARRLRSRPQPPVIVFLSMHESASYSDAVREVGAAAFVGKADFVVALLPIIEQLIPPPHHRAPDVPES